MRELNRRKMLAPILMTTGDILMAEKPTYNELERKIKKLEKEALEYMRKEREFNEERKLLKVSPGLSNVNGMYKARDKLPRTAPSIA